MLNNQENTATARQDGGLNEQAAQPKENSVVVTAGGVSSSQEIGQLVAALANANGSFDKIGKDAVNPFYKSRYTTLENLISATRKALGANGLVVMQFIGGDTSMVSVTSRICHSSGQFIESIVSAKPAKTDIQGLGGVCTFLKRYALAALLNVAADEDDDGNEAAKPETLSTEQIEVLDTLINGHDDIRIRLIKAYKALENIKAADFAMILNVVQKNIADKGKK